MQSESALAAISPIPLATQRNSVKSPLVSSKQRISSIDALRGVALLGLLLVHMPEFGLPGWGFASIVSGDRGFNYIFWLFNEILVEGKMRAIFTMLFGASVILFTARSETTDPAISISDSYYRRTLWLIGFGLLHAYFIWDGDILFYYGVFGLMLFPLRNASAKALLTAALVILAIGPIFTIGRARQYEATRAKAAAVEQAVKDGKSLSDDQREAQQAWAEARARFIPTPDSIAKDIADHRNGYWAAFKVRSGLVAQEHQRVLYRRGLFDMAAFMLIGMALFKLGVFSANRNRRFYAGLMFFGYGVGAPLTAYLINRAMASRFDPVTIMYSYMAYDLNRLLVALGHSGLVMLIIKSGALRWLTSRVAAVGQMALTNYLMQSIVCTLLFDGYGLGLYGKFQQYQLLYVLLAIWVFQLTISPIWLRHFRFGPMEWLWRSLTYWRRQPMRLHSPITVATNRASLEGSV